MMYMRNNTCFVEHLNSINIKIDEIRIEDSESGPIFSRSLCIPTNWEQSVFFFLKYILQRHRDIHSEIRSEIHSEISKKMLEKYIENTKSTLFHLENGNEDKRIHSILDFISFFIAFDALRENFY